MEHDDYEPASRMRIETGEERRLQGRIQQAQRQMAALDNLNALGVLAPSNAIGTAPGLLGRGSTHIADAMIHVQPHINHVWGTTAPLKAMMTHSLIDRTDFRKMMISGRLTAHKPEGASLPFEFLETHHTNGKVFVFVVSRGNHVTFEDDAGMFPSDVLINQLRLMM